ncbi:MAG: PAAR domain-containing protein [Telluria sp.]
MRRYAITLGSSTSSGGKVITAGSPMSIQGAPIALEGDVAFCGKCGHEGKIMCVGPRVPETWMGRQIALQDDLCVCRCSEPPKLISSQTLKYQDIVMSGSASPQPLGESAQATAADEGTHEFDEQFRVVTEDGETPLVHRRYRIFASTGEEWHGRTDENGLTKRVSTTKAAELTLEVFDEEEATK